MSAIHEAVHPRDGIPTVIDIEASGFGRGSYPIEIGFVLPDGRGDCMLIQPARQWRHWDPAAEALHRISRALLLAHGQPIDAVVDRLERQLHGLTVYSDGWGHDYSWLSRLYEEADRQPGFRLDSLQKLLTEDELARWDATKAAVFAETVQARQPCERRCATAAVDRRAAARTRPLMPPRGDLQKSITTRRLPAALAAYSASSARSSNSINVVASRG